MSGWLEPGQMDEYVDLWIVRDRWVDSHVTFIKKILIH